jgi:hypothetical protein
LRLCSDTPGLNPLDLTDDRLGIILDKYFDDEK